MPCGGLPTAPCELVAAPGAAMLLSTTCLTLRAFPSAAALLLHPFAVLLPGRSHACVTDGHVVRAQYHGAAPHLSTTAPGASHERAIRSAQCD